MYSRSRKDCNAPEPQSDLRLVYLLCMGAVFAASAVAGVACDQTGHQRVAVTRGECSTCHMPEFEAATQPLHVGVFPTTCGNCHDEAQWTPATSFDHDDFFPLHGAHARVACASCHTQGYGKGDTPKQCVGCHRDDYDSSPFPGHNTFSTECSGCHSTVAWKPASLTNHDQFFPLLGKHLDVECASCHTQGYAPGDTPDQCVGCHRDDYDNSPFPNHNTFPTTCADCHTEKGWVPATLPDHDQFFPLEGKHAETACASCHTTGYGEGQTPSECVGCHRDDYDNSPFPNHDTFPTTCADCHGTSAWKPASIPDHDRFFPIDGKHVGVSCASCHTQGYSPGDTPSECVGCHRDDYDNSPFPNHDTFPTSCTDCHMTSGWKPATLPDHDQFFVIDGKHVGVACASCHTTGYASGQTPSDCVGCHRSDYDNSPYPGHSSFSTTCTNCHTTNGWTPASGGHPETRFPIASGAHKNIACNDCHNPSLGPNSKDNADCVGCHTGIHALSVMDAKHREVGRYPTNSAASPPNFCLSCHPTGRND